MFEFFFLFILFLLPVEDRVLCHMHLPTRVRDEEEGTRQQEENQGSCALFFVQYNELFGWLKWLNDLVQHFRPGFFKIRFYA